VNCPECIARLQTALDERRAPAGDADLAAHLEACETCRLTFAAAERLLQGLELLPRPAPSSDFADRVLLRTTRARRLRRMDFVLRLAAAILLAVIGLSVAAMQLNRPRQADPLVPAPEFVERTPATPPPSLQAQLTEAREATYGLTRRLALDTSRGARLLLPPAGSLPDPATPVSFQSPAPSVEEMSRTVTEGLEPVTDSARRAFTLFRRLIPGEERKKS
jgi:hypothetical protein